MINLCFRSLVVVISIQLLSFGCKSSDTFDTSSAKKAFFEFASSVQEAESMEDFAKNPLWSKEAREYWQKKLKTRVHSTKVFKSIIKPPFDIRNDVKTSSRLEGNSKILSVSHSTLKNELEMLVVIEAVMVKEDSWRVKKIKFFSTNTPSIIKARLESQKWLPNI